MFRIVKIKNKTYNKSIVLSFMILTNLKLLLCSGDFLEKHTSVVTFNSDVLTFSRFIIMAY